MNSTNTRARCIPCYLDEQSSSNFFQVSLIRPTKLIKPRTHLRCYNVLPTIVAFNHLQMHVLFGFPFGRASPFWLTYAEYFDHCTLRISSGVYHTIGFVLFEPQPAHPVCDTHKVSAGFLHLSWDVWPREIMLRDLKGRSLLRDHDNVAAVCQSLTRLVFHFRGNLLFDWFPANAR